MLTEEVEDHGVSGHIIKVNTSFSRLHEFGQKLEETIERFSVAIEKADNKDEMQKLEAEGDTYFELITQIMARKDELKTCETILQERQNKIIKPETGNKLDQLIELQTQIIQQLQLQSTQHGEVAAPPNQNPSVKLPKLEMIAYNGDKQKFKEFWDQFDCTVHKNTKLSKVEKFSYLKSKLYGQAQSAISGLTLSNENYDVAINILKERFGDSQNAVNSHYVELINLAPATNRTSDLRLLYDKIEQHMRSLEALEQNIDQDVFISMITSKLPKEVLIQLEIQKGTDVKWTVKKLRDLLKTYVAARESAESHVSPQQEKPSDVRNFQHPRVLSNSPRFKPPNVRQPIMITSAEALIAGTHDRPFATNRNEPRKQCVFCKSSHWSDECNVYTTIDARKKRLSGNCFICLKTGHRLKECASDRKCVYCGKAKKHHRSLCLKRFPLNDTEISNLADEATDLPEVTQENALLSSGDVVLMQTAKAVIRNPSGNEYDKIRLLMDSGSQRTYITEAYARKLNLKFMSTEEVSVVTFGSDRPKTVKTPKVNFNLTLADGTLMNMDANVVPKITGTILRRPVEMEKCKNWEYLWSNFTLADTLPTEKETGTIELLVGNDYYLDLILPEKIELQPGLYLLGSKLGWIITGRTSETSDDRQTQSMLILNFGTEIQHGSLANTVVDQSLPMKPPLDSFWDLETIGIKDSLESTADMEAMNNFNQSVKFENDRYHVAWPWKNEPYDLPENKDLSYGRFRSLLHRLKNKPELLQKYNDIIDEQCKKGIIEKVDTHSEEQGIKHYIPHHAIVDPSKQTTKVRIVYDASARTKDTYKSLNDCLYRGPVMLQDLCGLLMRFRLNRIAVIADIEKAFLQLGLQSKDRDVTRFFWIKDTNAPIFDADNIQTYRFCRVPFGIVSSPFLLAATLDMHLQKYNTAAAENIRNNIYVDNVITGTDNIEEAKNFYKESKAIFTEASMNLRDWTSNSEQFMSVLPQSDRNSRDSLKVLGLSWTTYDDKLAVPTPKLNALTSSKTKREVLQVLASVFDPLGFFTPVTLRGKLFLQTLWNKRIEWDDSLSEEDLILWKPIATDIEEISNYKIPRHIGLANAGAETSYQLLCFCDASTKAYAATVYLRQETTDSCRVDLVFAKTRLAPNKKINIPRLELLAVVIGLRCLDFVEQHLKLSVKKILWTDSQCVLHWIATEKPLLTFVENRVKEIRRHANTDFRYVSTHENPADIASRGKSASDIKSDMLWWNGPLWLMYTQHNWPTWNSDMNTENTKCAESEYKRNKLSPQTELLAGEVHIGKVEDPVCSKAPFEIRCENYSSLTRLLRVTAWAYRFVKKLKKDDITGPLTAAELENANHKWIRHVQEKHFTNEISAIKDNKANNLRSQLGLTLDNMAIIRCVGRLEHSDISEEAKRPILLPKKDPFTGLITEHYHKRLLHVGVSQTLAQIRQKYWIPQGRSEVRKVLKRCGYCRRYEGGPYKMPLIPPLPRKRVSESAPFTYTGVDYFGPLYVKTVTGTEKVWVCLYTCLVVRAIHLELMQDMTAEQFLLGFRRFVARRGTPRQVISDNASQFKLASSAIDQMWKNVIVDEETLNYVANQGIEWNFIVELAPWMGGFYERLVALVKRSLRKTIGKICMNTEQLRTMLTEVEAVVNSRPLVYVGEDINSSTALTPSCFLTLNKQTGLPEHDNDMDEEYLPQMSSSQNLLNSWKKGLTHVNRFWKIWRDDYLLSLRERTTIKLKSNRVQSSEKPKNGDVVLIKDDLPRGSWKIGRIIQLRQSSDGHCRSAKILLPSNKVLNRALNFLYPLECGTTEEIQDEHVHTDTDIQVNMDKKSERPIRKSKLEARKKIQEWTSGDD